MPHILGVTFSGTVALAAIFLVDLVDIYFLSLLGSTEILAAMGYVGAIVFFAISLSIGLSIAAGSLAARALGEKDKNKTRRLATNSIIFAVCITSFIALLLLAYLRQILGLLGAEGQVLEYARNYLNILLPSMPLLGIGMCTTALLRSTGDAKLAMIVTLAGAGVNAVLDPIFIFSLNMGVEGAALASVFARATIVFLGLWGLHAKHKILAKPNFEKFRQDLPTLLHIAVPASLTNIATPIGNAFVTYYITRFGVEAVAAWAIINRLIPVAFSGLFALSGAVGPIVGQNLGAKKYDRIRQVLIDAVWINFIYSLIIWVLLFFSSNWLVGLFHTTGNTAYLLKQFCLWIAPGFAFMGLLFTANAAFNNLGKPLFSTISNWGRATIGNIPFILVGGISYGALGIVAGNMLGGIIFGCCAIYICFRLIASIEEGEKPQAG